MPWVRTKFGCIHDTMRMEVILTTSSVITEDKQTKSTYHRPPSYQVVDLVNGDIVKSDVCYVDGQTEAARHRRSHPLPCTNDNILAAEIYATLTACGVYNPGGIILIPDALENYALIREMEANLGSGDRRTVDMLLDRGDTGDLPTRVAFISDVPSTWYCWVIADIRNESAPAIAAEKFIGAVSSRYGQVLLLARPGLSLPSHDWLKARNVSPNSKIPHATLSNGDEFWLFERQISKVPVKPDEIKLFEKMCSLTSLSTHEGKGLPTARVIQWRGKNWVSVGGLYHGPRVERELIRVTPWDGIKRNTSSGSYTGIVFKNGDQKWLITGERIVAACEDMTAAEAAKPAQLSLF